MCASKFNHFHISDRLKIVGPNSIKEIKSLKNLNCLKLLDSALPKFKSLQYAALIQIEVMYNLGF
jgi:hypothetical protein